jgi:hypothetical protein
MDVWMGEVMEMTMGMKNGEMERWVGGEKYHWNWWGKWNIQMVHLT